MKKFFVIVFLLLISLPTNIYATTLKEYENVVQKYQNDINAKRKAINKTDGEIQAAENEIENIKYSMKKLAKEVETLNEEIEQGKVEIKKKNEETKQLFEYLQFSSGENIYLEYAFGADTVTDLIYRMSIVEQLTDYNDQVIDDVEKMIDDNHKREDTIKKKQKEMTASQKNLESKIVQLGNEKSTLAAGAVSSQQQLKIYQDIVNSYKKQGCKSNDVIGVDCAVAASAGVFRRPTDHGVVSSEVGYRWGSFHQGMDITASNPYNTKIYPVADGTVIAKYTDYYGALVLSIEHYNVVDGKWYTSTYGHMSKYAPNIYVGKKMTSNDYLGYMGSTGYSTGPHLHLEVAPCRLYKDSTCLTWNKYSSYLEKLYNQGYKFARKLISFPSSWNTR